jgi:hypothetical protein
MWGYEHVRASKYGSTEVHGTCVVNRLKYTTAVATTCWRTSSLFLSRGAGTHEAHPGKNSACVSHLTTEVMRSGEGQRIR